MALSSTASASLPASPESSSPRRKYDVFISFRGIDTRCGLITHLYDQFLNKGIKTFKDDEILEKGMNISSSLLTAVQESRFAIVVLSPNYASSSWCLDELTTIFQCMEESDTIMPLFYHVDPPDARYQRRTFEAAFNKHEMIRNLEKVQQWRDALNKLGNMPGWDFKNYESEEEVVEDIVEFVWSKLQHSEIESAIWTEDEPADLWKHDVFLSFRALDTKKGFLSHLYDELQSRGINTFKDDKQLQKSTRISPSVLMAIQESRFVIVLLSAEYASSIWCLNELTRVFECVEDKDTILPVFYDVDPSTVRNQRGSFEVAFNEHESIQDKKKVEQWRVALKEVGNLFGLESKDYETERDLVKGIVHFIARKVLPSKIESTGYYDATIEADRTSPGWKYDVFLSFRGPDTRRGIVSHLYEELQNKKGINTFKDDEGLQVGMEITPALLMMIKESSFAIIVLSENYASSAWCLDELTRILEYMKDRNRILPLFYYVEPSDVRHLKNSYEKAFDTHKQKSRYEEKLKQWQDALNAVANLSGWDTKNFKTERELVKEIVDEVCEKVGQVPSEIEYTMPTGEFKAFEATKKAMNDVMTALEKDEVTAIGVYGIGGVGKTTMVKHVGARAKRKRLFRQVIMVAGPHSFDFRKIQCVLADFLGLKLHELTENKIASRLKEEIMRRSKILLILDDIRERIDFSRIGIPNYNELQRCKSKVLFTTRRRNLCHAMRTQAIITLNVLSEPDSWNLFIKKSRRQLHGSIDFYKIAREVAKGCLGLPLALIAVAKTVGDSFDKWKQAKEIDDCVVGKESAKAPVDKDDLGKWEEAAQRLQRSETHDLDQEGDVFKCIKLSYDCLKTEDVKSLILLCALFPEDDDIRIEDLIEYVLGKGLFRDSDSMQESKATAHLVVEYLKACSFLSDGTKDGCVRMHDAVRDVAISVLLSEDSHGSSLMNAHIFCSEISLLVNKICKFPEELVCLTVKAEKLQYVECKNLNNVLVECDHEKIHGLKYLAVINCHAIVEELMNAIRWVPKKPVFENLEELHLLGLCWLKKLCVGDLPQGSLSNLKLLKVETCHNLVNAFLPPAFHNLKTLVVNCCIKLKSLFPVEVAQCLPQLEDLSISQCPSFLRVIEASEETVEKKIAFPKLNKLVLCSLPQLTWFYCTGSVTIDCPSLEHLYVQDCPMFSTSTSDFHTWKQVEVSDLRHLRTMYDRPLV